MMMDITMRFDCYYFDKNERIVNQFIVKKIGRQHTVQSVHVNFQFLPDGLAEAQKEIELGIFETLDQAITAIFYELWFMERENDLYHPDKTDLLAEPFERTIALIKGAHQSVISIYGCSKKYKYRRIEDKPNVDLPFFFDDIIPENLKRHLIKKPRKYKTVKLKFLARNFQSK